jgi:hypothetical protein
MLANNGLADFRCSLTALLLPDLGLGYSVTVGQHPVVGALDSQIL